MKYVTKKVNFLFTKNFTLFREKDFQIKNSVKKLEYSLPRYNVEKNFGFFVKDHNEGLTSLEREKYLSQINFVEKHFILPFFINMIEYILEYIEENPQDENLDNIPDFEYDYGLKQFNCKVFLFIMKNVEMNNRMDDSRKNFLYLIPFYKNKTSEEIASKYKIFIDHFIKINRMDPNFGKSSKSYLKSWRKIFRKKIVSGLVDHNDLLLLSKENLNF